MKKILVVLSSFILLISSMFVFTGCLPWLFVDTDEDAAREDLESLIKCMENDDHDGVKNLFASNRISDMEGFDEDIDELLLYFDGEVTSIKSGGLLTDNDVDGKIKKTWYVIGGDIVTSTGSYFINTYICEQDTSDKNNVGVWSIFIFNHNDNPDKDYSFYPGSWGDKVMDGIHIIRYKDGQLISK